MKKRLVISILTLLVIGLTVLGVKVTTGMQNSPYTAIETVSWFFRLFRASSDNPAGIEKCAITGIITPGSTPVATIIAFGDLMPLRAAALPVPDQSLVDLFHKADLVIGNCESSVVLNADQYNSKGMAFLSDKCSIQRFLSTFGIDNRKMIFNVANNHAGDAGPDAVFQTRQILRSLGVNVTGAKNEKGEPDTCLVDIRGKRVGVTGATQWMNRCGASASRDVVMLGEIASTDWLAYKKKFGVDLMVLTPHWGYEFRYYPDAATADLATRLMNNGADIILGHHPHLLQPVSIDDQRLCAYSLGNLVSTIPTLPSRVVGVLEIGLDETLAITHYTLHPFIQHKTGDVWRIIPVKNAGGKISETATAHLKRIITHN